MKIKIKKISKKQIETKFGLKNSYGILNEYDNQWYSCFEHLDMKNWREGMEVEANVKVNGQFKNIEFPKREKTYQPSNNQLIEAMKVQLDRIEKKIDRLMGATVAVMPVEETPLEMPKDYYEKHGLPTDIPPPPSDDDNYDTRGDSPF